MQALTHFTLDLMERSRTIAHTHVSYYYINYYLWVWRWLGEHPVEEPALLCHGRGAGGRHLASLVVQP